MPEINLNSDLTIEFCWNFYWKSNIEFQSKAASGLKGPVVDDELKKFLQFLLTNDKFKPPNHKKLLCFTLVCLWNVQIQILNQPKRPS